MTPEARSFPAPAYSRVGSLWDGMPETPQGRVCVEQDTTAFWRCSGAERAGSEAVGRERKAINILNSQPALLR